MNGTVLWLVSLITRIANGERCEHASAAQWKLGLSIVSAFFFFAGPAIYIFNRFNPQSTLRAWLLWTALFSCAFLGWYYVIRRLRVLLLLLCGVAGWLFVAATAWR